MLWENDFIDKTTNTLINNIRRDLLNKMLNTSEKNFNLNNCYILFTVKVSCINTIVNQWLI